MFSMILSFLCEVMVVSFQILVLYFWKSTNFLGSIGSFSGWILSTVGFHGWLVSHPKFFVKFIRQVWFSENKVPPNFMALDGLNHDCPHLKWPQMAGIAPWGPWTAARWLLKRCCAACLPQQPEIHWQFHYDTVPAQQMVVWGNHHLFLVLCGSRIVQLYILYTHIYTHTYL